MAVKIMVEIRTLKKMIPADAPAIPAVQFDASAITAV